MALMLLEKAMYEENAQKRTEMNILETERLDEIMAYLRQKHTGTVSALSRRLFVSEATIRRDLTELERQGFVKRVYGGAVLVSSVQSEVPMLLRAQQNSRPKAQIAAMAARHLQNGQTIFLDASSTAMHLVKHLESVQSLTIITNGVKTAVELQALNQHTVYCTGGRMLHNSSAYVGAYAEDFIRQFNADVLFFSSRGVSEDGLITDASCDENHIRRVMFEHSRKHIFLCDQSKMGHTYSYNLCSLQQVDDFITNA